MNKIKQNQNKISPQNFQYQAKKKIFKKINTLNCYQEQKKNYFDINNADRFVTCQYPSC